MAHGLGGGELTAEGGEVAVVVTCYGYAHLLGEAIGSALDQGLPPAEIVVVDDGSPDDPGAVVELYADRGVTLVSRRNGGPGAARNTGAQACRSPYLVFLDADDRLEPTYVERTLGVLAGSDDDVGYVYTQCRYFGAQEGVTTFPQWDVRRLLRWPFVHASALLKTEPAREYPYDEHRRAGVEDWDFYLTLAEHGIRGVLLDEPLLLYRKHGGSSRGDLFDSDPAADAAFRQILRKHWRLGGLSHAARVEAYYMKRRLSASLRGSRRRAEPSPPPMP